MTIQSLMEMAMCKTPFFSLSPHCLLETLFQKQNFTLCLCLKTENQLASLSFSFSFFFFFGRKSRTVRDLLAANLLPTETGDVSPVSLAWVGPPRRRDHPTLCHHVSYILFSPNVNLFQQHA
jgi:hypothetical protein